MPIILTDTLVDLLKEQVYAREALSMKQHFVSMPVFPVPDHLKDFMQDRVQFRFPRCKRKRIRKKWAKDPRNWRTVHTAYMLNDDRVDALSLGYGAVKLINW